MKLQVINDLIHDFMLFNERDDLHLTSTGRAQQRAHFIYLTDHLRPATSQAALCYFELSLAPIDLLSRHVLYSMTKGRGKIGPLNAYTAIAAENEFLIFRLSSLFIFLPFFLNLLWLLYILVVFHKFLTVQIFPRPQ
jgi:hypothetical protein